MITIQEANQWHYKKQDEFRKRYPNAPLKKLLSYCDRLDAIWKWMLGYA